MARGRGPTASASSSVLGRSSAVQTLEASAPDVERLVCAPLPVLHGAEPGRQLIKVDLLDVHLTQEGAGQGVRVARLLLPTSAGPYWGRPRRRGR